MIMAIVSIFIGFAAFYPDYGRQIKKEFYVAIELNTVLCGYSRIVLFDSMISDQKVEILKQETFASFFALGRDITQHQIFTYHINPASGNFIYHDSYHKQGEIELSGAVYVERDVIRVTSPEKEEEITTGLPVNLILPNTQFCPYLLNDFVVNQLDTKTYPVFNLRTGKIVEMTYSKVGDEKLDLAGEHFDAVVLTEPDPASGLITRIWIDKKSGMRLKMVSPNRLSMYLTDASVQRKIKTGNWDNIFFTKTNLAIKDLRSISYMKVKASLEPVPAVGLGDVQVPGQKFTGQVSDKKLEGIFEISHEKFDGKTALPFPPDFSQSVHLGPYLKEAEMIESNDTVLLATAKQVTDGSENLWEATCRLSHWITKNIHGSILGGSARETFDHKSGLCGSQSMLMAALCRAVGIPARVVWGCLYTPEYGGSFGHHAWNEVFIGEAGWIPIDVTIHETDYVDSGHIRFGVLNTRQTQINSWVMEILEFKTED